jgi:hypothetical protein
VIRAGPVGCGAGDEAAGALGAGVVGAGVLGIGVICPGSDVGAGRAGSDVGKTPLGAGTVPGVAGMTGAGDGAGDGLDVAAGAGAGAGFVGPDWITGNGTGLGAGVGGDWAMAAQPIPTAASARLARPIVLFIAIPPGLRGRFAEATIGAGCPNGPSLYPAVERGQAGVWLGGRGNGNLDKYVPA